MDVLNNILELLPNPGDNGVELTAGEFGDMLKPPGDPGVMENPVEFNPTRKKTIKITQLIIISRRWATKGCTNPLRYEPFVSSEK